MVPWRPHNIVILGAGLVTTVLSPLSPPLANEAQLREVLCGVTEPNMCACVSAVWGSLTASGSNTLHHTFVIDCLSAGWQGRAPTKARHIICYMFYLE